MLAAIAGKTERISLGSAVTVLSTDDPVRVFQRFSTLNAISNGRAEVILGPRVVHRVVSALRLRPGALRGAVRREARAVRRAAEAGTGDLERPTRSALDNQIMYPPIETGTLRTWVGVGGSPESVVRAARYGLPLTLAIIGGSPQRFLPYVDLYHQSLERYGKPTQPVAVHSPGHVARDRRAGEERALAALRGDDDPHRRRARMAAGEPRALRSRGRTGRRALRRIAGDRGRQDRRRRSRRSGLSRFDMKYSSGTLPHDALMTSIELFGTKVAPRVRELVESTGAKISP